MTLDLTFFMLAVPAVIFAGVSKGGFGSGAAFAATPLLALILEPAQAVGLMLPLLMLMDVGALRPYWRQWDGTAALALIAGGVPGVALGAVFFGMADPDLIRLLIGAIALGFVGYQMARARGAIPRAERFASRTAGLSFGAVAGFTSFVSHAGGPPAAIYLLSRGLDKGTYQATTVIVFWAVNLMKAVPYAALGFFTWDSLRAGLYLAPLAFLGVWIGVRLHRMIPEQAFFALVYVLLTATGTKLIFDAVS